MAGASLAAALLLVAGAPLAVASADSAVHEYRFDTISSPQETGIAFTITVRALNNGGQTPTGIAKDALLTLVNCSACSISPTRIVFDRDTKTYTGPVTITGGTGATVQIKATQDGGGVSSLSNEFVLRARATSSHSPAPGTGWWASYTATISCTPLPGSHCNEIRYSIDGGAETSLTPPAHAAGATTSVAFAVPGGGERLVSYYSLSAPTGAAAVYRIAEAPKSFTVKVDSTGPTIAFLSRLPAANANGWNQAPVTVTWTCSDTVSGVVASPVSTTVSLQGAGQSATGTCTDLAGNTASSTVTGINVDSSLPLIAIATPCALPGLPGWCRGETTIFGNATDAVSAIAASTCTLTDVLTLDAIVVPCGGHSITSDGRFLYEAMTTDLADNVASASLTVRVDATAPVLDVTLVGIVGDNGWHRSPVFFGMDATDAMSGMLNGLTFDLGSGEQAFTAGFFLADGVHGLDAFAKDRAGNVATFSETVRVDSVPPSVTAFVRCADLGSGPLCTDGVEVGGDASDGGSGLAAAAECILFSTAEPAGVVVDCDGEVVTGSDAYVLVVTATDTAGNVGSATAAFRIDGTNPIVAIALDCALDGSPGWCLSPAFDYEASAFDLESLVVSFTCTVDGAPADCAGVVTGEGLHTVAGRAEDEAANVAEHERSLAIDSLPPEVAFVAACADPSEEDESICLGGATVTFLAHDWPPEGSGLAHVLCLLNDVVYDPCVLDTPIDVAEGSHFAVIVATDVAGNVNATGGPVTLDTTPPFWFEFEDVVAEATGPLGAVVSFEPELGDDGSGPGAVLCAPASGSTFPLGATPVTCDGWDRAGNQADPLLFHVTVEDNTPPVITGPSGVSVVSSGSPAVSYTVTAFDLVDGEVPVLCDPASGSVFVVGSTSVTCNASDAEGNAAVPHVFLVTVTRPASGGSSGGGGGGGGGSVPPAEVPPAPPANTPPTVELLCALPDCRFSSLATAFSAVAADADGDTLTLSWSLGDGTSATGAAVEHDYAARGRYTVSVTASDGKASATASREVVVSPPLDIHVDDIVLEPGMNTVDVSASEPLARVEIFLDGESVAFSGSEPHNLTFVLDASDLRPGMVARIVVLDEIGEEHSVEVGVTVVLPPEPEEDEAVEVAEAPVVPDPDPALPPEEDGSRFPWFWALFGLAAAGIAAVVVRNRLRPKA